MEFALYENEGEKCMRLLFALSGLLCLSSAVAAEYPIDIKTDLKGQYFVVEKGGTVKKPILVVKMVRPGKTIYSKRAFDCEARASRYISIGSTLETMAKMEPEEKMTPLVEGSIDDQLARHVCPKK